MVTHSRTKVAAMSAVAAVALLVEDFTVGDFTVHSPSLGIYCWEFQCAL